VLSLERFSKAARPGSFGVPARAVAGHSAGKELPFSILITLLVGAAVGRLRVISGIPWWPVVLRRATNSMPPLTLRKRRELKNMRDGRLGSNIWRLAVAAASGDVRLRGEELTQG
jgi:hypothetical protein